MKYIDNRLNANIVKLKDANNNYTSENVEGALEEIDSKVKNIEANGYDDTQIRQDINNIKTEIGTEDLITTDQTIKGAVNEVNSQVKDIKKKQMKIINVDEYTSINDAISVASTKPYSTLYFPSDKTVTETVYIPAGINIKMDGRLILNTDEQIPALVIGGEGVRNECVELQLKVVRQRLSQWSSTNDVGIQIYNIRCSIITILHCEKFETGIQLIASGDGIAHNIFNFTNIVRNRVHLEFLAIGDTGYINENTFNGGRFTSSFGLSGYEGFEKVGIKMTNVGSNSYNNNVFIRPCFQIGVNGYGIVWDNAKANTIISARVEDTDYIAKFDGNCEFNNIEIGYEISLDIPCIDNSKNKTNFITHLRNIDKDKVNVLLKQYDQLVNRYCVYYKSDTNTTYSLSSLSIAKISGSTENIRNHQSGISVVDNKYIDLTGVAIGNKVDTSRNKKIKICKTTTIPEDGFTKGVIFVKCYDDNGNALDDTTGTHVFGSGKSAERFEWNTYLGGCYKTSGGTDEIMFTVSDETKSIWVGVGTTSSYTVRIRDFSIYGESYCSVYDGCEGVRDCLSADSTPEHTPIGTNIIIYKAGTITDYLGWIYNGTEWKKIMIGS